MLIPDALLHLAPDSLRNERVSRFDGTGFEVPVARFAPEDQAVLRTIYGRVQGLADMWKAMREDPDLPMLEAHIVSDCGDTLAGVAARLGAATRAAGREDAAVRKVLHDVRGGGLTVLAGLGGLLAGAPGDGGMVRTCVDAARDHAKIMRNLFPDIDPDGRAADETMKPHQIGHFVDKFDGMAAAGVAGPVSVRVRCAYRGVITFRCLETASVDRVLYNLLNNAARFSADGQVTLWVFPVGDHLIRWVVQNRVNDDEAAYLTGTDLSKLYAGGLTRGGHGIGLLNCAEIIAECFGLPASAEAVAAKLIGAAAVGTEYYAWFHWPGSEDEAGGNGGEVSP